MTRKPLFLVYDKRSEANTRADTVPCAVRFDEDSTLASNFEERTERQLPPYAVRPELLPSNDDPTVVDGSASRTGFVAGRISEVRKASEPPPPPRSAPRRERPEASPPNELEATVRYSLAPEPAQRRAAESNAEPQAPADPLPSQRALLRSANGPARRWILLLAALLAAVPAFLFGMSLGNGRLQRAVRALFGSGPEVQAPAAPVEPTARARAPSTPAPEHVAASAPLAASAAPAVSAAPAASEPRKVPAVRFEDLAVAEEEAPGDDQAAPAKRQPARRRGRR